MVSTGAAWYGGSLYLAGRDAGIWKADLDNLSNSELLFPWAFDFINVTTALDHAVTVPVTCDSAMLCFTFQTLDNVWEVYRFDTTTLTREYVCSLGDDYGISGLASPREWQMLPCAMAIDLDGDDSSGAVGGDFAVGPICTRGDTLAIADTDLWLSSEKGTFDSLVVNLTDGQPGDLLIEPPPTAGIASSSTPPDRLVAINTGEAVVAHFTDWLAQVLLLPTAMAGSRTVAVTPWANGFAGDTVYAYFALPTLAASAGSDGALSLCPDAMPTDLFTALTGSPAAGGSWYFGPQSATGQFDPTQQVAGQYTYVQVSNSVCPDDTATVEVTLSPVPQIDLGDDVIYCDEASALLVPGPAATYLWSDGSQQATLAVSESGTYWVEATHASGCTAVDSVALIFHTSVSVQETRELCAGDNYVFEGQTYSADTLVEAVYVSSVGCDSTFQLQLVFQPLPEGQLPMLVESCPDETTVLDPGTFVQYLWQDGSSEPQFIATESGWYTVTLTDGNGCSSVDGTEIIYNDPPLVTATAQAPLCPDEPTGMLTVAVTGTSGPWLYQLADGALQADPVFTELAAGTYAIVVQDIAGCLYTITATVPVATAIEISVPPIHTYTSGAAPLMIEPVVQSDLPYRLDWSGSDGFSCADCASVALTPTITTTYQVTATDTNGCTAFAELTVEVVARRQVMIPNVFSPNDDGRNDTFTVLGQPGSFRIIELAIYDRWDGQIFAASDFEINDTRGRWDGTWRGRFVSPGTYVYAVLIEWADGQREHKMGDVVLLR